MFAFLRKNQILLSCYFCLLLSLYIVSAAARGQLKSDPIGPVLMWLFRPLQLGVQLTTEWVQELHESYGTLAAFKAENDRLRKRIQTLEIERNQWLEAEATNRRLQQLLEFRSHLPIGSVTASIIANSASTWFQSCLLDKGSDDRVRKGMAVVTPLGVVGQVVSVTARSAKVLLITDANSGVDVLVQRTRARGIVSGSLENGPVLKYVKRSEDIQVGDRLITSGLDGIFPKGMMVGTVIKARKQNLGLFQYIEVMPAVTSARAEEVMVVSANPSQGSK
ncbi:MAG TPA: rod shape-determining protein MreC [Candidatus Binatia bacterium]